MEGGACGCAVWAAVNSLREITASSAALYQHAEVQSLPNLPKLFCLAYPCLKAGFYVQNQLRQQTCWQSKRDSIIRYGDGEALETRRLQGLKAAELWLEQQIEL